MDQTTSSVILLVLLPGVAVVGLVLNLFIRARGGRSFHMHLKGFGIDLSIASTAPTDDQEVRDIGREVDEVKQGKV